MNKLKRFILLLMTNTLGRFLVAFQPKRVEKLKQEGITLAMDKELSFTERLMRNVILSKTISEGRPEELEQLHVNYWENRGAEFFQSNESSFQKFFLKDCAFIFDLLEAEVDEDLSKYKTLVEIGTGNGRVLKYLHDKFSQIEQFVGIDLSKSQIELNRKKYLEFEKLNFEAIDGFDWIKKNGSENTIFVTSRGVLEYFTQQRLAELLKTINALGNAIFIAIEPNANGHDFEVNPESIVYGYERSFSHNYPKLFKDAGFTLWHVSYKDFDHLSIQSFIGAKG